jgi:hypothetical protein
MGHSLVRDPQLTGETAGHEQRAARYGLRGGVESRRHLRHMLDQTASLLTDEERTSLIQSLERPAERMAVGLVSSCKPDAANSSVADRTSGERGQAPEESGEAASVLRRADTR